MVDIPDVAIMALAVVGLLSTLIAFAWTFQGTQRFVRHQIHKYKVWRHGTLRLYIK